MKTISSIRKEQLTKESYVFYNKSQYLNKPNSNTIQFNSNQFIKAYIINSNFLSLVGTRHVVPIPHLQSRRQSSSLSRMTEGEKSSGEPLNRRLSHWFSRGTKNTHTIGSFKLKVCLKLFSASATYYKYARKEKLFAFRNIG